MVQLSNWNFIWNGNFFYGVFNRELGFIWAPKNWLIKSPVACVIYYVVETVI